MRVFEVKIKFDSISKRKKIMNGELSNDEYLDSRRVNEIYYVLAEDDINSRNVAIELLKKQYKKDVVVSYDEVGLVVIYCETNFVCKISE